MVAAVEPVRDVAVALAVLRQIGVEQEQTDVPDAGLPDARPHFAPRERHRDVEIRPVLPAHGRDRQVVEIRIEILGALGALAIYGLDEVALLVEQPHRHERQLAVARRLAVVAGEDAEPAGVDRHALVEAELGTEIRDEVALGEERRVLLGYRLRVVGIEGGEHAVETRQEYGIGRRRRQPLLVQALQHRLGAVSHGVPQRGVQPREERARRPIPAVPQVAGELFEAQQPARNPRIYFQRIGSGRRHMLKSGPENNTAC
jgi:hypothetical protein